MAGRRYSVKEVSERSGVSARALRLWDEMGLVVSERLANGYRSYTSEDLERLRRILIFHACGMELKEIRLIRDADDAELCSVLRRQLSLLHRREQELSSLIGTVEETIQGYEEGRVMSDTEKFEQMKREAVAENDERYGEEVRERYGEKTVEEANERVLAMDQGTWDHLKELEQKIVCQLERAMDAGDVAGPAAQEFVGLHAQ